MERRVLSPWDFINKPGACKTRYSPSKHSGISLAETNHFQRRQEDLSGSEAARRASKSLDTMMNKRKRAKEQE